MSTNGAPLLPAAVVQVETAFPAFIGYTQKAITQTAAVTLVPVIIGSMSDYIRVFGGPENEKNMEVLVSTGAVAETHITIQFAAGKTACKHNMYYALQMFFANGGGPCYIISVGASSSAGVIDPLQLKKGLDVLQNEDAPSIIVFPEAVQGLQDAAYAVLIAQILQQCATLRDQFVVLDVKTNDTLTIAENAAAFRSLVNGSAGLMSYGAAYFPNLKTAIPYFFSDADIRVTDRRTATATVSTLAAIQQSQPPLYQQIKKELNGFCVDIPPASAVAGVYVSTDRDRGVWKAPANKALNNIRGPRVKIGERDSENLNIDPLAGKSINPLREFIGKGTLVWGARTLAGNDNEWRYVSVRRFFMMVEESVKKATLQFVFEPNDRNTWTKVMIIIQDYLVILWRQGALTGMRPADAFYVKTGLGITMTAIDVLNGLLIVEIGMAAIRPAEFIIFRFSQKMQQA
ncbi:MAG: phage tail sheath C-terminal domain-containing protein [Chitinophagaceae bacterium]